MKKILIGLLSFFFFTVSHAAMKPLTVYLTSPTNPNNTPLFLAKEKGYFKKENLAVKFSSLPKNHSLEQILLKQPNSIGLMLEPELIQKIANGAPLKRIGTLIDKPLDCIVTLKSSQITQLAELKNKKLGVINTESASLLLNNLLNTIKTSPKEANIVKLGPDYLQALANHEVDAIVGLQRNTDIPNFEAHHLAINVFFPEEENIINYEAYVFVMPKNGNFNNAQAFLKAVQKAINFLGENPKLAWKNLKTVRDHSTLAYQNYLTTLPYFAENTTESNTAEWHQFASLMKDQNLIHLVPTFNNEIAEG